MLATGSRVPRDLPVPGRELDGVHFAMDYLYQRNRWVARAAGPDADGAAQPPIGREITAAGKDVVVIGGGDTGADCVGNALREGARSIVQLELLAEPPAHRPDDRTPWPQWPLKYRLSYAMEEARELGVGEQDYSVTTTALRRRRRRRGGGAARSLRPRPRRRSRRSPAPSASCPRSWCCWRWASCTPSRRCSTSSASRRTPRGNVKAVKPYTTSVEGVFAAGDARRGQSLIVWAINEGRQCARMVDRYLAAQRREDDGSLALAGEDGGLAGHADADGGPEGPPQHVGPGVGASEA